MDTIKIVVSPSPNVPSPDAPHRFTARLGQRIVCSSRIPLLDAARVLLDEGIDPTTPIEMWHKGASEYALRSTVGHAASLTVKEPNDRRIHFAPWKARASVPRAGARRGNGVGDCRVRVRRRPTKTGYPVTKLGGG